MAVNRYGVDVSYFRGELAALSRSLENRTPGELYRYLLRLSEVVAPGVVIKSEDPKDLYIYRCSFHPGVCQYQKGHSGYYCSLPPEVSKCGHRKLRPGQKKEM